MTFTRFFAAKFKDEYAGDDEKSSQIREEIFQKHLALYRSRSYVSNVQGKHGDQDASIAHGYHYGILVDFESEEKLAYYNKEDPEHQAFAVEAHHYVQAIFAWAFPSH